MNEKIAKLAEQAIGKNREQVNCGGTYAWCARFVSNILTAAGVDGINTFSCSEMFNTMKSRPLDWSERTTILNAVTLSFSTGTESKRKSRLTMWEL